MGHTEDTLAGSDLDPYLWDLTPVVDQQLQNRVQRPRVRGVGWDDWLQLVLEPRRKVHSGTVHDALTGPHPVAGCDHRGRG